MHKIYHLSTCSTCRRIIKEVAPDNTKFEFQDLKEASVTEQQLDEIYEKTQSYKDIFNKQARKYREMNLHLKDLSDSDMRELILSEYTFLKRPVFLINDRIFVGNNKKVINELHAFLATLKKNSERVKY